MRERAEMARRCAWCLRFCVDGTWLHGGGAGGAAVLDTATHTICEDCLEELRRQGLSV
jgi:hypothetical protein